MSDRSNRGAGKRTGSGDLEERNRLLKAAVLLGAVVVLVLVGWVLQTDSADSPLYPPRQPGEKAETPEVTNHPTITQPGADIEGGSLAPQAADAAARWDARLHDDVERLGNHGGEWTLQLLVACDPENLSRFLDLAGGYDELYLLPIQLGERSCYRLCWGTYPSREHADRAVAVPTALRRSLEEAPRPRPVDELLP